MKSDNDDSSHRNSLWHGLLRLHLKDPQVATGRLLFRITDNYRNERYGNRQQTYDTKQGPANVQQTCYNCNITTLENKLGVRLAAETKDSFT